MKILFGAEYQNRTGIFGLEDRNNNYYTNPAFKILLEIIKIIRYKQPHNRLTYGCV